MEGGGGGDRPPGSSALEASYRRLQRILPPVLVAVAIAVGGAAALLGEGPPEATEALSVSATSLFFGLLALLVASAGAFAFVAAVRGRSRDLSSGLVLAGGGSGLLLVGFGLVAMGQTGLHPVPVLWVELLSWATVVLGGLTLASLLGARPRTWGKASPGLPGVLLAGFFIGLAMLAAPTFQGSRAKAYEVAVRSELRRLDSAQVRFREDGAADFARTLEPLGLETRSPIRLEILRADEEGYAARGTFADEPVGPCAVYRGGDGFRLAPAVSPGAVSCEPIEAEAGLPTYILAALIAAWLLAAGTSAWILRPATGTE